LKTGWRTLPSADLVGERLLEPRLSLDQRQLSQVMAIEIEKIESDHQVVSQFEI
jgi:hypothetical protein